MFEAVGDIIDGAAGGQGRARRTHQPVRRHSHLAGRQYGTFWRPVSRRDADRIILAAEKFELTSKPFGRRNGALGGIALEVLRYLANRIDYKTGRLEPSIETMMEKLCRSRDAIVRALKALRAHGFLDWLRRYVTTGAEGRGPQVHQTSNAYRLFLPAAAAKLLGRYFAPPPLPDDHSHARAQRAAELDAHQASLSLAEMPLFAIEDEGLAQALSRLGAALDRRESARRSESLSNSIFKRQK